MDWIDGYDSPTDPSALAAALGLRELARDSAGVVWGPP